MIVAVVVLVTVPLVAVKLALPAPARMTRFVGREISAELEETATAMAEVALAVKFTVQVAL